MQRKEEIVNKLEEALDLIDKLESLISRLQPHEEVNPGVIYQLYQAIVFLREKILEVRFIVAQEKSG